MSDRDAVLFANEAFYAAFEGRDYESMEKLWSQTAPISCIHPGGGPVYDREAVLKGWQSILSNQTTSDIRCIGPRVRMFGDYAVVICFEVIAGNNLIASNTFVREGRAWKLVHHQAGPTAEDPPRVLLSEKGPSRCN